MAREKGAVLVTGASTGIGRACALELERSGFRVFAGVRKKRDAESLGAEGSERLAPVTLDVARPSSIAQARGEVEDKVGEARLAGLVNNAGIASGGPIEHLPMKEFRRVLNVNLLGSIAVTQAFLPLLRRGGGRVVFITSIGGRIAYPYMSPYHASKWGLEAVADSLRRELRPWRMKVIVIEPGTVSTPIWDKGIDTFGSLRKEMPSQALRDYGDSLNRMATTLGANQENGISPERVARVVRRALTRPFPDTRYRVGIDARVSFALSRLLGDRLFDRMVARVMGIPRRPPD